MRDHPTERRSPLCKFDSRTLTLQEVRADQAGSKVGTLDTRHPAQVESAAARHDSNDRVALTVLHIRPAHVHPTEEVSTLDDPSQVTHH